MFNRRTLLTLAVCAILSTTTAFAGSGGTKKDATIGVRNDSSGPIAAFVDPDAAKVGALPANPTQAQIEAAGGQLINAGGIATFKVTAGTYTLAAGPTIATAASTSVAIGKGKTKNYAFKNGALLSY